MSRYTHIFFDLDRTLWDYDSNATETLDDLIDRYQIMNGYPLEKDAFFKEFFVVNDDLWAKFDKGLIDKDFIRNNRFQMVFKRLGLNEFRNFEELQNDFISECPTKGILIDGAMSIVEKLSGMYSLLIITNGFDGIQHSKLKHSGLEDFFKEVITSERAKVQKPNPVIFDYALSIAEAEKPATVMIGDNFDSDILGAHTAGIDQIYYNPHNKKKKFKPTYEITHLDQLADILL